MSGITPAFASTRLSQPYVLHTDGERIPHHACNLMCVQLLMNDTLDILCAEFPGQVMLSPCEVARPLYGDEKATPKRIEGVRKMLDEGTLCPDLRKAPNERRGWIPIAALARALEQRYVHTAPSLSPPALVPLGRRSRMTNIGPRLLR